MAFTRSAVRSRLAPPVPRKHASASRGLRLLQLPATSAPAMSVGALAVGSFAIGALAVGALAIGALAIGRLSVRRATAQKVHLGEVEIDDLIVRRLRVVETSRKDPSYEDRDGDR
jgi:hypothetical protein